MAAGKASPRAYLVTGAGFQREFWPSLIVALYFTRGGLASFPWLQELVASTYDALLDKLMRGAHGMMWWSLFGLLSSSCCAVQLVLNMMNFGCAGFNTYLGPLRPIFLAVTTALQIKMWELAMPNIGLPSTPDYFVPSLIISTSFTALLAFLPEITDLRTRRLSAADASSSDSGADAKRVLAVLALEGLGCVACSSAVKGVLRELEPEPIAHSSVLLEQSEAHVTLTCELEKARDEVLPALISKIEDCGFGASVKSLDAAPTSGADAAAAGKGDGCGSCGSERPASGAQRALAAVGLQSSFATLVAGLLSSSCCLLQLGVNLLATLNVLHVGCAGFNKVLGPWRLHLRCASLLWMLGSWLLSPKARRSRLVANLLLLLAVMFLPEVLRATGGPAIAPPTEGSKVLRLNISGMGCEACESHVRAVVDRSPGVVAARRVDFTQGFAEIEVAADWHFNLTDVAAKLAYDGYEVEIPVAPTAAELPATAQGLGSRATEL